VSSTHFISSRRVFGVALAATMLVLALAASAAQATPGQGDAATAFMERHFQHEDAVYGARGVQTADWLERYAAMHPYGQGLIDGVTDGRSPDTLDAAASPQPVLHSQPSGFDWGDAGIGAGFASGLSTLLAAIGLTWMRRHPRQRIQTT